MPLGHSPRSRQNRIVLTTTRTLERGECFSLLQSRSVGRLALNISALPTIEPVRRYVVLNDEILLFVSRDSRIREAMHFNVVCFEVDDLDHEGLGQHVVVVGQTMPAARSLIELVSGATVDRDASLFVLRCELIQGEATTRAIVDDTSQESAR
jgi:hypothetical protein